MSALGGIWAPAAMKLVRSAAYKASKVIRTKLSTATRPVNTALEPVLARCPPRQPVHPAAFLRQQKSRRWYSTSTYRNINAAVRRFMSTGRLEGAARPDRTKFLNTQTGRAVAGFAGRAPFASTLRPNLTGGALPRTAGGYGLGSGRVGGARYFSHTPAAPAQVMQNVSIACRAFWVSGQKAQFDGVTARGDNRYRAVTAKQDEASRKLATFPRVAPGSYVDFRLNPTVTALSPLAAGFLFPSTDSKVAVSNDVSLNTDGFLDVLSSDFARAVKDLTATLADIQRLCSLGDLPIQLEKDHTLRVRFPGVDAETVECLCDELGLTRGTVGQDRGFDEETGVPMALKFPFAPGPGPGPRAKTEETTPTSTLSGSEDSFPADEMLFEAIDEMSENPWLSSPDLEGYETMSPPMSSGEHVSEDFEGMSGIYRFVEECDRAREGFR